MGAEVWPVAGGTGHRPQHLHPTVEPWARAQLARIARHLRDVYGTEWAVSGMALGFDMWWADEAVKAGLRLWVHVPFRSRLSGGRRRKGGSGTGWSCSRSGAPCTGTCPAWKARCGAGLWCGCCTSATTG